MAGSAAYTSFGDGALPDGDRRRLRSSHFHDRRTSKLCSRNPAYLSSLSESRIAPASVTISPLTKSATWTDHDRDAVTLKRDTNLPTGFLKKHAVPRTACSARKTKNLLLHFHCRSGRKCGFGCIAPPFGFRGCSGCSGRIGRQRSDRSSRGGRCRGAHLSFGSCRGWSRRGRPTYDRCFRTVGRVHQSSFERKNLS